MKLCVVAFPNLGGDAEWIGDLRRQYDPIERQIAPHVTLVFPTETISSALLISEVSRVVRSTERFEVKLRSAIMMPDPESLQKKAHVFLVPDEGFSDLVRLHDRLYAGILRSALRLDLAFIPHLTVGAGLELENAKVVVDEVNSRPFEIGFMLREVFVFEVGNKERDRDLSGPIKLAQ